MGAPACGEGCGKTELQSEEAHRILVEIPEAPKKMLHSLKMSAWESHETYVSFIWIVQSSNSYKWKQCKQRVSWDHHEDCRVNSLAPSKVNRMCPQLENQLTCLIMFVLSQQKLKCKSVTGAGRWVSLTQCRQSPGSISDRCLHG